MEEIAGAIIVIWFIVVTVFSGIFLLGDYRDFSHVKQQCASQGYIQNTTVRINCSLEERK